VLLVVERYGCCGTVLCKLGAVHRFYEEFMKRASNVEDFSGDSTLPSIFELIGVKLKEPWIAMMEGIKHVAKEINITTMQRGESRSPDVGWKFQARCGRRESLLQLRSGDLTLNVRDENHPSEWPEYPHQVENKTEGRLLPGRLVKAIGGQLFGTHRRRYTSKLEGNW
jgi:hypothetical protein